MIRFAVDSIDAAREGPIVAGRIAEGTVRLGSTFTEVIGRDQFRRTFRLTVKQIFSYRRLWDELEEGMSAELLLVGDGMEELKKALLWATITGPD